ncbi:MAG TPA: MFS transporter [bacterium]|nr:MFS transporter [bacterium]
MKLWTAQTISVFGDRFSELAIPLIAVLTLSATPGQMGILTAVTRAPFLLIGLFAGVWVDRLPRRPVLITGDMGRAVVLLSIPLAAALGGLSMLLLYAVGVLVGILTVFFDVAYQAYLPALVHRGQLVEGNSKLEATRSLAGLAGPSIAGVVIQLLSAPVAIVLDAISFVASGGLISLIRRRESAIERSVRGLVLLEVREGLSVVLGNPLLRSIAGCTGTTNFFSSALFALYILFATRELNLGPAQIGVIFSIGGVTGLIGALTAGWVAHRLGVGRTIVGASLLFGLAQLPVAAASAGTAWLLILSTMLVSFANPIYNINQVSLRQAITPHKLQGRMNATMRFLVWGTMPLGGILGGVLGSSVGLRAAIGVAAAGGLLAFLWVALSPVRTLQAIPNATE